MKTTGLTVSIILVTLAPVETDPCDPSPCGPNAQCREINGIAVCACIADYFGDPYTGCTPECVINSQCPFTRSCLNQHCVDPCPGTCGVNAECAVVNHNPLCTCRRGTTGDAFIRCIPIVAPSKSLDEKMRSKPTFLI